MDPFELGYYRLLVCHEPDISAMIMRISGSFFDVRISDFEHRIKPLSSVEEKLCLVPIREMKDIIRYTFVVPENVYSPRCFELIDAFSEHNASYLDIKNLWCTDSPYHAMHLHLLDPSGIRFEVQIHTELSRQRKMCMHLAYKKNLPISGELFYQNRPAGIEYLQTTIFEAAGYPVGLLSYCGKCFLVIFPSTT